MTNRAAQHYGADVMPEGLRTFRIIRVDMYADWLDHDADGLIFNLANPSDQPIPNARNEY
jgi:hypothetical protein